MRPCSKVRKTESEINETHCATSTLSRIVSLSFEEVELADEEFELRIGACGKAASMYVVIAADSKIQPPELCRIILLGDYTFYFLFC